MKLITGVILTGGKSSRMGGQDKGLLLFKGKPLYYHVLQRLEYQVDNIIISANRNIHIYKKSNYAVITDLIHADCGPLSGILNALEIIPGDWAAFCSCDTPLIPYDYIIRLWNKKNNSPAVWVRTINRHYPILALINKSLTYNLIKFLLNKNYRVIDFLRMNQGHGVIFSDSDIHFSNINTLDSLEQIIKINDK
ncbi:molybdenum cofactor guanylyltransferase MobA [Candidatus Ishikawella capsulata]|uniref:Molybdenum cofactor guanylyltransferase n=1 Tax=Candidatus Ishikawaella capsulata Mpkobe TaxID=476281 RepID=C5WDT2_9ENTR|nr:molybdenum cofactor guanylyltransferase MobA [Candidatus Ishikawaella capsulata]BAH83488.1 molybdopterin-guanine dinucleotide biosynthesis protein A [Candidatus Ishikawaella capsulata Mpkobe]